MVPRYNYAVNKAMMFLLANQTDGKLPVNPFEIICNKGWGLTAFTDYAREHGVNVDFLCDNLLTKESITFCDRRDPRNPKFHILYNDTIEDKRQVNICLLHEVAHIALDHFHEPCVPQLCFDKRIFKNPESAVHMEREANAFAINLLCPAPLLEVYRFEKKELMDVFGLSAESANFRLKYAGADLDCISLDIWLDIAERFGFSTRQKLFKPFS